MIRKWTPEEDKILRPLLESTDSETVTGREGVMMLAGEGFRRTECSVRHRIRLMKGKGNN